MFNYGKYICTECFNPIILDRFDENFIYKCIHCDHEDVKTLEEALVIEDILLYNQLEEPTDEEIQKCARQIEKYNLDFVAREYCNYIRLCCSYYNLEFK
jgi:hypothetical protein